MKPDLYLCKECHALYADKAMHDDPNREDFLDQPCYSHDKWAGLVLVQRLEAAMNVLRCHVTNNRCGADTWMLGYQCPCSPCSAYVILLGRQ